MSAAKKKKKTSGGPKAPARPTRRDFGERIYALSRELGDWADAEEQHELPGPIDPEGTDDLRLVADILWATANLLHFVEFDWARAGGKPGDRIALLVAGIEALTATNTTAGRPARDASQRWWLSAAERARVRARERYGDAKVPS